MAPARPKTGERIGLSGKTSSFSPPLSCDAVALATAALVDTTVKDVEKNAEFEDGVGAPSSKVRDAAAEPAVLLLVVANFDVVPVDTANEVLDASRTAILLLLR